MLFSAACSLKIALFIIWPHPVHALFCKLQICSRNFFLFSQRWLCSSLQALADTRAFLSFTFVRDSPQLHLENAPVKSRLWNSSSDVFLAAPLWKNVMYCNALEKHMTRFQNKSTLFKAIAFANNFNEYN